GIRPYVDDAYCPGSGKGRFRISDNRSPGGEVRVLPRIGRTATLVGDIGVLAHHDDALRSILHWNGAHILIAGEVDDADRIPHVQNDIKSFAIGRKSETAVIDRA